MREGALWSVRSGHPQPYNQRAVAPAKQKTLLLAVMLLTGITPLAAHTHTNENSRLGLDTFKISLHQEIEQTNPLNALGIDADVRQTCIRSRSTAKERDAETGLDWFKTRYFSAAQGRFTSPDKPFSDQFPEDPQSWNLYTYVRNNPLKMVDEDGESATLVGGIGGALIGGAVAAWRGESVWKGAVSGAVAGALAGAVIDTGGVALGVYGAAAAGGALGGVGGGIVGRSLNGQETTVQDVAIDAGLGAAGGVVGAAAGKAVVAVGQRIAGPSAAFETLRPGPYASESIPATGPRVTPAQAQQLRGQPCHTCGTGSPGTRSGNPVGDHQPSTGLAVRGGSQQLYPHCTSCSGRQGSQVRQQNQTWRGQQRTGGQAGAGAGTAGTRRPEDEHN